MITPAQIQSVSDEIARRFRPDKIILFGSYAHGRLGCRLAGCSAV